MIKIGFLFNFLFATLFITSCQSDPCSSKDSFLVFQASFIKNIEENANSFSEKQWEENDSIFDSLWGNCYKKFEDDLTRREDKELRNGSKIYITQRFEHGIGGSMAKLGEKFGKIFGDDFEDAINGFGREMNDVFDEDFTVIFEKFGDDMEDIFDEDFRESLEDMGDDFEEVFDEEFKNSMKDFGKQLKEIFDEDFKDELKSSMGDLKIELEKISKEVKEKRKQKI